MWIDRRGVLRRALVPELVTAGGGRRCSGRPGADSMGLSVDDHGVRGRGRDRRAVRFPTSTGPQSLRAGLIDAGELPAGAEVWASTPTLRLRPGPRLMDGAATFGAILHPDRCGPPDVSPPPPM